MDEDLNELDALFAEIGGNEGAEEQANGGFADLEDGLYDCEIAEAEWTKSKDGVPMVKIEFGIANDNRKIWDYLMFGHKEADREKVSRAVSRSVTKLRELGLEADDISGYVSQLNKLPGTRLQIELTTSKSGFQNKSYKNVNA